MRWIKHLSTASQDETMEALIDKFGAEGYGAWWLLLETIAFQMEPGNDRCHAQFPVRVWAKKLQLSPKKFQLFLNFLQVFQKIKVLILKKDQKVLKKPETFFENLSEMVSIECLNLLKYRDEYTKKATPNVRTNSGHTPDKLQNDSGQTPVQDTDTDTDTDTPPKSPSGRGTFSKPKRPKKYAHEIQPAAPEKIPPDSKKKRLADLEESGILNLDPPSVKDMFRLRDEVTPDPSPNQMAAECDELEQLLKDNQMDDLKEKIIQSRIEVLSRRMENVS